MPGIQSLVPHGNVVPGGSDLPACAAKPDEAEIAPCVEELSQWCHPLRECAAIRIGKVCHSGAQGQQAQVAVTCFTWHCRCATGVPVPHVGLAEAWWSGTGQCRVDAIGVPARGELHVGGVQGRHCQVRRPIGVDEVRVEQGSATWGSPGRGRGFHRRCVKPGVVGGHGDETPSRDAFCRDRPQVERWE